MHEPSLILTLTGALAAGLALGYATNYLRLSPIVGYLLAGIVVGPFTPGFTADQQIAQQLAEVGVMLLMFGVGLHFKLEDLLAVRRVALPGAVAQITVAILLGALMAIYLGWHIQTGIVYGLCLSVASTVVLTRILVDNRQLHTPTGHVAVGWLIVQDLFAVLALVVLPILFSDTSSGADLILTLGIVVLKLLALFVIVFWMGKNFIPWVFSEAAQSSSKELFTLTVLVSALGIAVGASLLFEVSMALGAFLAGMAVGKSEFSLRAASEALPLRDAFAVLFFVSVGMLLNPSVLVSHAPLIALTLGVVIIGKTVAAFSIVLLLGYPIKVALEVSVALAQIGEFSFILAYLGKELGVLDEVAINAMVATAILSITLNPLLFRMLPYLEDWIAERRGLTRVLTSLSRGNDLQHKSGHSRPALAPGHAVIVGYGPIGRTACRLLRENGIAATVIELDLEKSRQLRSEGVPVIYGDASREETLESADISNAGTLILSASSISGPEQIVKEAKALNPSIRIIARTAYARETGALRSAGCEAVFSGEGEVALALAEQVLRNFGATPEQIERERYRVRREIIDKEASST